MRGWFPVAVIIAASLLLAAPTRGWHPHKPLANGGVIPLRKVWLIGGKILPPNYLSNLPQRFAKNGSMEILTHRRDERSN